MSNSRGRGPPARRSQYRVLVTDLPPSGSWQDLKDHMREAGDVCFADVYKDGTGVVEFLRHDDMKYAVKKLDDSRFRSHEVRMMIFILSCCYVTVYGVHCDFIPAVTCGSNNFIYRHVMLREYLRIIRIVINVIFHLL